MSGRQGQAFTSWLMMIPLLVVPMIAIFGMPKMELLSVNNAEGEELDLELGGEGDFDQSLPPMPTDQFEGSEPPTRFASNSNSRSNRDAGWNDPFDNPQDFGNESVRDETSMKSNAGDYVDPFASAQQDPSGSNPFLQRNSNPPSSPSTPNPGQPRQENISPGYTRPNQGAGTGTVPSATATAAANLRWREAVKRLNELGVQKYQLSQTEEPFVFQFACDLTHPDNPRITHRFQAEAGEPLQAVAKVIQQVETWSAQLNNR